jgi:hypothetical protein
MTRRCKSRKHGVGCSCPSQAVTKNRNTGGDLLFLLFLLFGSFFSLSLPFARFKRFTSNITYEASTTSVYFQPPTSAVSLNLSFSCFALRSLLLFNIPYSSFLKPQLPVSISQSQSWTPKSSPLPASTPNPPIGSFNMELRGSV